MLSNAKSKIINLTASIAAILTLPAPICRDLVRDSEWHLDFLKIKDAHAISTGAGIIVGLPDTGIHPHHDISHNLIAGKNLIDTANSEDTDDENGHGTELAGLIVGHGHGTGEGILGIAPSAHLIPIKAYKTALPNSKLTEGIALASEMGAQIINVSAGTSPSRDLQAAIQAAKQADAVVVAASGNDTSTAKLSYPAALPGVLAVGAIDRTGKHAAFSISGPNISLCAPGDEIVTTGLDSGYRKARGTSAAAAIVSGAAALVRARFPGLSAREVVHRLTATATDIGAPGRDEQCGYGVLNIVKALTADVPPLGVASPGAEGSRSAAGEADPAGRGWGVRVLGGIAAVLAGGVVVGFLAARRRKWRRF
ncbi:S8 family serine peptidase [Actinoplanes awajinensis]|uniref:S8 family serine peptidase n=1 Tax=Actinoplanes awajinensis TaxID=135946 RepID=UPI000A071748|nr:S8 family serine peptidase [Actinoplanes awajinensis]